MKSKLKILHLEDESFDVELVERALKKADIFFEKMVVDTKIDFENALISFAPDIILSDHSLPAFNSLGAIKIVNERAPGTPVILVTATVSEEFAVNVLQLGASDYVLKNNLKRLPSAVLGAIEKAKAIKEKDVAESALQQSHGQLRSLASHLQNVREEERSAIAREVHDELGQQLTAIKLDIEWMMLKLSAAESGLIQKMEEMEKLVITTLKTVKKIVTELHPAILDKLGIIEAIKWQALEFEKRTGIKIQLSLTEEDIHIGHKTSIALFRIVQESLTNIARHAGASNVSCSLQKWDNDIFLMIADDGRGFEISSAEGRQTLGILGMKERTVMVGGKYEISSEPGKGTKILVVMPVTEY